jgi:hypothetical protein
MQKSELLRALQQEIRRHGLQLFRRPAAFNRAGRERCRRAGLSGVPYRQAKSVLLGWGLFVEVTPDGL